jgi:hypothetical protein
VLEVVALAIMVLAQTPQVELPTLVVAVVVLVRELAVRQLMLVKAAQASSSFPMLAHNNLVAVSSLQVVVTPFTHLQLLALLFQLHL